MERKIGHASAISNNAKNHLFISLYAFSKHLCKLTRDVQTSGQKRGGSHVTENREYSTFGVTVFTRLPSKKIRKRGDDHSRGHVF